MLGGVVSSGVIGGEYGRMPMDIQPGSRLYSFQSNSKPNVWMSHGDEAVKLPEGFNVVAKSEQVGQATAAVAATVAEPAGIARSYSKSKGRGGQQMPDCDTCSQAVACYKGPIVIVIMK